MNKENIPGPFRRVAPVLGGAPGCGHNAAMHRRRFLLFVLLGALAGLGGCPRPGALVRPVAPPPLSRLPAVQALAESALAAGRRGDWATAAALYERALRLEPRNPRLWHGLARVRYAQEEYRQVLSLAAKSNLLAGGDHRLRAANWRLMGDARHALGEEALAQAAYDRAGRLDPSGPGRWW